VKLSYNAVLCDYCATAGRSVKLTYGIGGLISEEVIENICEAERELKLANGITPVRDEITGREWAFVP
jgi:hypothetical protein